MQNNKEIPIFFSCDENYIPYLAVSIKSLADNTSIENTYHIYVLTSKISLEKQQEIKIFEKSNIKIEFISLIEKVREISKKLDDVRDYYTQTIFYRIFIANMFKQYDKAIYLDCDICVLSDIAEFYNIDLENNILGAIVDRVVANNEDFKVYTKATLDIWGKDYINSGVLLINLDEYRRQQIEEKFIYLLNKYTFPSVAPDQDYLNYLCCGKIKFLDESWNRMPIKEDNYQGKLNLIHYNMFMKPWHYDGVLYEEYFWQYAKKTIYYDTLLAAKQNYSEDARKSDLEGVSRMVKQAYEIINSQNNFNAKLIQKNIKL